MRAACVQCRVRKVSTTVSWPFVTELCPRRLFVYEHTSSANLAGSRSWLTPRRSAAMVQPLVVSHANACALTVLSNKLVPTPEAMPSSFHQSGAAPRPVSSAVP